MLAKNCSMLCSSTAAVTNPTNSPLRARYLARDLDHPGPGGAVAYGLAHEGCQPRVGLEREEEVAVRRPSIGRDRPCAGEVEQLAVGVEQREGADVGQADDLVLEHQMDVASGQFALEVLAGRDPACLEPLDQIDLHALGRLENAIGLRREDERDVPQLALAVDQRHVAQIQDRHRGAGCRPRQSARRRLRRAG